VLGFCVRYAQGARRWLRALAAARLPQPVALKLNLFGKADFPLAASPVEPQGELALHEHDCLELVLVTGGHATHRLELESFPIEKGDVFVVPPGMSHGYGNCRALDLMNVVFDLKRLELPEYQLLRIPGYVALFSLEPRLRVRDGFKSRLKLDNQALAEVLQLIGLLRKETLERKPTFELACTGLLTTVLVHLARSYAAMTTPQSQALMRVASVVEWLNQHFVDPIALEDLARRAHMSKSTLGRCFQECFGMAPMSYLIDLRLKQAEHLLRDTNTLIRDIAPRIGIDNPSYFARIFRKRTGLEPSAYRERHQSSPASLPPRP